MEPATTSHFSLEEVLPAEHDRLLRLCARLSGSAEAAEDLTQETLVEAWRCRDKLHDPTGYDRWLSAIARNVCLRWKARRSRRRTILSLGADGPPVHTLECVVPDDFNLEMELERNELAGLLDRAMAVLPPATRRALLHRYIEDLPVAEIAQRLGVLSVLTLTHMIRLWQLYLASLAFGAAGAFFFLAVFALIPRVLPAAQLNAGNGLMESTNGLTSFIGPALAGVLIAGIGRTTGITLVFAIDAATFAIAVSALQLLSPSCKGTAAQSDDAEIPAARLSLARSILDGLRFAWRDPGLRIEGGIGNVIFGTWLQVRTDPSMLGRVTSLVALANLGLTPISYAISGVLVDLNPTLTFVLAGGLVLAAVALSGQSAGVRAME